MQLSHLPNSPATDADLRALRQYVLRGEGVPFLLEERLVARGYDVAALEQRITEMNRLAS